MPHWKLIVTGCIVCALPTANADYQSISTTLTFNMADSMVQEMCVNVSLVDDSIFEDDESFVVSLHVEHSAVSIHIQETTVTIEDNDQVTVSFLANETSIPESIGVWQLCVQLTGQTERSVPYQVDISQRDGESWTIS